MRVLHLFAGAGGSHLAGELLGWESAGSVEIDEYCQRVLRARYPNEAIHDDIRTFDARGLRVDGITGGFPCQDISSAGKGAGLAGARSGLWKEFARIIGEARPAWAFIENSPLLRSRGLETVLGDLAALGYDAEWATYRASDVGAPHRRDRIWILAYSAQLLGDGSPYIPRRSVGSGEVSESGDSGGAQSVADPYCTHEQRGVEQSSRIHPEQSHTYGSGGWWAHDPAEIPESGMGQMVDGVAHRVDRLRAIGNGWVPLQAAVAWKGLMERATRRFEHDP